MKADLAKCADGRLAMPKQALQDFCEHAREAFPEECVGYVNASGRYIRLKNTSPRPELTTLVESEVIADLLDANDIRCYCHSHPNGPDAPSEQDMIAQRDMEVLFAIVSTNGEANLPPFVWGDQLKQREPLVGREFRHGVTDCYALIRDYFYEQGIELGDYPRNWEWWLDSTPGEKNLYARYFAEQGFTPIDPSEVREGDCFLAQVRSDVPNHAGVYIGDGLMLHHVASGLAYDPRKLSRREPVARWIPYITHWLRYSAT